MTDPLEASGPFPAGFKPRILHCITSLQLGGAERMTVSLLSQLQGEFAFAVHAMLRGKPGVVGESLRADLATLGVPVFRGTRLPIKFGGMLTGGVALARTVRRFQPDLIHLHTEIPEAGCAAMLAMHPAFRTIALARTIHNSRYWHHWPKIGRWVEHHLPPAHVTAVSRDALATFDAHAQHTGRRARSTILIYNGAAQPAARTSRPRPPGARLRLLFAGRLEQQKGADLLPAILAHLPAALAQQCELTVLGAGEFASVIHRLAANPPDGWRVTAGPAVRDLAAHLEEFDVVLMPSRFEGLSLLAIEVLMRRIPLIATTAPGLRETFPVGYPWLATPGNAADFARVLQAALQNRSDWHHVMAGAQRHALREFDLAKMAAGYSQLYREILRRPATP